MKKHITTLLLIYFINLAYTQTIKDFSFENYPRVDGSISTFSLNKVIACKLLNIEYRRMTDRGWAMTIYDSLMPRRATQLKSSVPFMNERIQASGTHQAFISLIENDKDIILTTRKMSKEENKYADSLGVKLIETPIALDAVIFFVNKNRGITALTPQQIQDIYMGKISRWETIGGDSAILYPYINTNSTIQEWMGKIVMMDLKTNWDDCILMERNNIFKMITTENPYAVYFSVYYHLAMMNDEYPNVQTLSINGIEPNSKTIADRIYPYVAELYAVIRSDLPQDNLAYKLYEWIQSEEGQAVIKESGYVPIKKRLY